MLHARSVVVLLVFIMYILDCAGLKTFDTIYTDRHSGKFMVFICTQIHMNIYRYTHMHVFIFILFCEKDF